MEQRIDKIPDWWIVEIPFGDGPKIATIRNDTRPSGVKKVLVQYLDRTASYISPTAKVRVLRPLHEIVYAEMKALESER